ncbi:MAG: hypothetical protein M1814_005931 [Vezdaea aestivalis]|nr:MAG: hypothetical protein M1814_005931 [Vezdaea aestivalis]
MKPQSTVPVLPDQDRGLPLPLQDDHPPSYSGPSTPLAQASLAQAPPPNPPVITSLPSIDFSQYFVSESTVSADQTTLITHLPTLSSDKAALLSFIRAQAALPPRPEIRIRGRHKDFNGHLKTSFDIRLNMLRYLVPSPPESWNYIRIVGAEEAALRGVKSAGKRASPTPETLEEWVSRFVKDRSTPKTFTLTRAVVNWDTEYLDGQIRGLIAATKYNGQVDVTFPLANSKVVVHSPTNGNQFLSKIMSTFMGVNQYEVATAVWPYATQAPGAQHSQSIPRTCAVQSEDLWWRNWKDTIRYAILSQKQGWLSTDDFIEGAMGGYARIPEGKPWGGS